MAFRSAVLLVVAFVAIGSAATATDEEAAWWQTARAKMEAVLAARGRTLADVESPPWYEVPYSTVGRMPLIDTGLREPLVLPEVAMWADDGAKEAKGRGQPGEQYRAWSDHWKRVQSDQVVRSVSPEQRKSGVCRAQIETAR